MKLSLEKLHCTAADDVIIAKNEEMLTENCKTAVLWIYLNDGSKIRVTEKDSSAEFILAPGEALTFWIKGKLSVNDQWKSGDLGLSMLYRLETAEREE